MSNNVITYLHSSTCQKMACMFNPFPRFMFAGHRPQLRRSSRIRQQSFPKITSTEPIDLVQSSSASEPDDDMEHQTKTYRKSGNKAKVTAGRPVQDSHHTTVYLYIISKSRLLFYHTIVFHRRHRISSHHCIIMISLYFITPLYIPSL